MYVTVSSSRRVCFNFRTYFFHSLPVDPNACLHSLVLVVILNEVVFCTVYCECLFIVFLQWGKENVNSRTNYKASIHVSELVMLTGQPNAWYVNQELLYLWCIRVLLIFDPTWNVRSTRKLLEVKREAKQVWHCEAYKMMLYQRQKVHLCFVP